MDELDWHVTFSGGEYCSVRSGAMLTIRHVILPGLKKGLIQGEKGRPIGDHVMTSEADKLPRKEKQMKEEK
jgi:hypothetical protein